MSLTNKIASVFQNLAYRFQHSSYYREVYKEKRFRHKCDRAFQLQSSIIGSDGHIIRKPRVKRDIDRSLKIAASIYGWEAVTKQLRVDYGRTEEFICLHLSCRFLQKREGFTERAYQMLMEMEESELAQDIVDFCENEPDDEFLQD